MIKNLLIAFILVLLISSAVHAQKFILQTTAPLVSFQHARLNGVGLGIQGKHLNASLSWIQYSDRSSGKLLHVSGEGWIRIRSGKLLQVSYRIPTRFFDLCIGANYLILPDEYYSGYQLAVQKWINEFAFIRLGIGQIGLAKSIFANIGVDLPAIIREAGRQLNHGTQTKPSCVKARS